MHHFWSIYEAKFPHKTLRINTKLYQHVTNESTTSASKASMTLKNDPLELAIAKSLAEIFSKKDLNLDLVTIASIVEELETKSGEQNGLIKQTKKKFIRAMVQAHLDESHFGHAKAKRGEPWTSMEMILKGEEEEKEKEKELKEDSDDEEEESDDEDVSDAERGTYYHSAKRTTRGDTNPSKKKQQKRTGSGGKSTTSSTKEMKDPNKPKGPQGPYMCFVSHNREKIVKEFPGISFGECGKKLGQRWQNLSEKGKEMYNEMAEKDKKRYEKEMEKYVPMSDTELNKLKAKAEKEKKERSENSGFKKPYKCSERLKTFLNGQETITRAQLTSQMWAYFKEKNLKDPENKQFVISDDKLFKLIGERRFKAFGFIKYLSKDLIPM